MCNLFARGPGLSNVGQRSWSRERRCAAHKLVISYSELHLIHVVHSFEEVTRCAFAWHRMVAALTWGGRSGGSRAEIRTFVESRCSSKWPLAGICSRPVS
jgi:hypothetical protein